MLAMHAGVDWDWEMPALFVWLFGAGGVALAARDGRELGRARPHAADRRRAGRARAGDHAGAVRALAGSARPRRRPPSRARDCATAIDDALTATERFGARPEPWQVLGYCDARLGQYALARARDGRRPRARPGQLAVRLRPGDRLRRVRRATRGRTPGEALRLNPLGAARPATLSRPGRARRPRPAGDEIARRAADTVRCELLRPTRCGAAAQDQAAGEQREAAEQDRDRREAGERQLAGLGRGRVLARRLGSVAGWTPRPGSDAAALGRRRRLPSSARCSSPRRGGRRPLRRRRPADAPLPLGWASRPGARCRAASGRGRRRGRGRAVLRRRQRCRRMPRRSPGPRRRC